MSELSEIIATKDAAIEELKSRLAKGAGGMNRRTSGAGGASAGGIPETEENVALLTEALKEREEKIEHLQQQLAEAARLVTSSAMTNTESDSNHELLF